MITAVLVHVVARGHGFVTASVSLVVDVRYGVAVSNMVDIRLGPAVENKQQAKN